MKSQKEKQNKKKMGISGSHENLEKKPVVLIVGGGYGGVQCAKSLDKTGQYFIVLIDRKSYFLHNIGALRATVERDFARKIITPYDRLLTNGCVVQAEVVSITNTGVQVNGRNEPIPFDYLVIATGSSYAFPGKVAEVDGPKAINIYNDLQDKIGHAQQILIVGGGPVGIELAGEIATDFPGKDITLVHSKGILLQPDIYNEKVPVRLQGQLEKLGVKIILNDRIQVSSGQDIHHMNYIEGRKSYRTENSKQTISADLTFICTGAHVNNKSLLNGPLKSKINRQTGRLIVNNYLQVDGFENIFAIGDISDKEAKFGYMAGEQGDYVGKLIPIVQKKKPYPKEYKGHENPAIFVTTGRNGGIGQLPTKGGTVVGSFVLKFLKSKDVFASRQQSILNAHSEDKSANANKVHSLQSVLSFTEKDAQDLIAGLPVRDLEPGQDYI